VRNLPHYRHQSFVDGLKKHGYSVQPEPSKNPHDDDVIVTWNRQGVYDTLAKRYRTVIVAENGYIGADKSFALSLDHHNGAGWTPAPAYDRLTRLNLDIQPWRESGTRILILPQRGVGEHGVAMPFRWPHDIQTTLRRLTKRPLYVRPHPGRFKSEPHDDFPGAWCAITWGSTAAIKAIIAGIPVFHAFPQWIAASAASGDLSRLETPMTGDRAPMLERLSWAQWSADEVQSGYALDYYLARNPP
jgi:hypothetical protein